MSFNLAVMLRESRNAAPAKKFLRFPEGALTYAEVDTLSGQFAAALRRRGLPPGDKVAVQLPNVPQFVIAYFGILKAGLAMVPLNPLLKAAEIAYHLEDSDARMIIAHSRLADEVNAALKDASGQDRRVIGECRPDVAVVRRVEQLVEADPAGGCRGVAHGDGGHAGRPGEDVVQNAQAREQPEPLKGPRHAQLRQVMRPLSA
jgi:acyl-CoA synthetase (AMP-forming)/AMP-acid ligase II